MARVGQALTRQDLIENVHGPLFALVVHAWCALAGGSDAALRAPSAWCGVATVPAMAWLSSRWLGRETAGWAAWLTAGSPFLVWYSQEARPYSMLILLVCVSSAMMLELSRLGARRTGAAYAASVVVGMLTAPAFGFVLPLHLRWWLADAARRRRRLIQAVALALALAVVALPWLPQFRATWDWQRLHPGRAAEAAETPLRGPTTFHLAAFPYALFTYAVGYTLGPSPRELRANASMATLRRHAAEIASVALLCGGIALIGLLALARRRRLWDAVLWLGVPTLVVSWFAMSNFKVFHPRYLSTAVPLVLLVAAAAFADLGARARAVLGGLLLLLWGVSLTHLYRSPAYGKEDVRDAAQRISALAAPDEKVLMVNTSDLMRYYYHGAAPLEDFWLGLASNPPKLEHEFDLAISDVPAAWVVLSRPEDLDPDGSFAKLMDRRTPVGDRIDFEGVRVWHARRVAQPASNAVN